MRWTISRRPFSSATFLERRCRRSGGEHRSRRPAGNAPGPRVYDVNDPQQASKLPGAITGGIGIPRSKSVVSGDYGWLAGTLAPPDARQSKSPISDERKLLTVRGIEC